jgi:hypothetical protein
MTATELTRRLSDAALTYRTTRDDQALAQLHSLARVAAAHVRRAGEGTVDHIVLSSILKLIASEAPSVGQVLQQAGWHWLA